MRGEVDIFSCCPPLHFDDSLFIVAKMSRFQTDRPIKTNKRRPYCAGAESKSVAAELLLPPDSVGHFGARVPARKAHAAAHASAVDRGSASEAGAVEI
jgi:hypothetical protein